MSIVLQSVILGVLAAVGWGIADFLAAVVSKRLGILRTALGVHVVSVALTTAYFLESGVISVTPGHWLALAGIGVIGFVTYIVFYKALQTGPVAIVSPIVSTYAVVVIFLAIVFSGERLGVFQIIGVSVSITGVVLASANLRGLRNGERIVSVGVLLGVIATLCIGTWQYGIGVLSREIGWFLPIYVSRVIAFALLLPMVVALRELHWYRYSFPLIAGVVAIGVVETGGLFAFSRGTEIGVISVVAAASIMYPIIPMVGGLLIFRESLGPTQWIGLVVALSGLLILAMGS